jgi:hypothetical protein
MNPKTPQVQQEKYFMEYMKKSQILQNVDSRYVIYPKSTLFNLKFFEKNKKSISQGNQIQIQFLKIFFHRHALTLLLLISFKRIYPPNYSKKKRIEGGFESSVRS